MRIQTWQGVMMSVLLATTVACNGRKSDSERANGVGSTTGDNRGVTGTNGSADTTGTYNSSAAGTASGMQSSSNAAGQNASGTSGANSTLTGCLQKSGGRDFMLTMIEQPSTSVGTAGNDSGTTVAREQMQAAARSYKLQSNDDRQFDSLVGHQVRVIGSASEPASLGSTSGSTAAGSNQSNTSQSRPRENQLAEFKVTSITQVAPSCSQGTTGTSGAINQSGTSGQFGTRGSSNSNDTTNSNNSSAAGGGQSDRSNPPNDR